MKLNELTIKEAISGLKKGEFTSEELTKACLLAVKNKDKDINAFITVTDKLALAEARASDTRRKNKDLRGSLDGVPITLKDNMALVDFPTTSGSNRCREKCSRARRSARLPRPPRTLQAPGWR